MATRSLKHRHFIGQAAVFLPMATVVLSPEISFAQSGQSPARNPKQNQAAKPKKESKSPPPQNNTIAAPKSNNAPKQDPKRVWSESYFNLIYNFLSEVEGNRNTSYQCTSDRCTIGIGFNLDANPGLFKKTLGVDDNYLEKVKAGAITLTDNQIRKLFHVSLAEAEETARRKLDLDGVDFDQLPERRRAVIVSLTFNSPALLGPKLRAALKNGDDITAAAEIALNSNRKQVWGLSVRREKEAVLFLNRQLDKTEREKFLGRELNQTEREQYESYQGQHISMRAVYMIEFAWANYGKPSALRIATQTVSMQPSPADQMAQWNMAAANMRDAGKIPTVKPDPKIARLIANRSALESV